MKQQNNQVLQIPICVPRLQNSNLYYEISCTLVITVTSTKLFPRGPRVHADVQVLGLPCTRHESVIHVTRYFTTRSVRVFYNLLMFIVSYRWPMQMKHVEKESRFSPRLSYALNLVPRRGGVLHRRKKVSPATCVL